MKAHSTVHLNNYRAQDGPAIYVMQSRHAGTGAHDHDYYELAYIEEGTGLHDWDGRMNLVMGGDLIILPPGTVHRYIGESDLRLYNCMFEAAALRMSPLDCEGSGLIARLFPLGGYTQAHLELDEQERIRARLSRMAQCCKEPAFGWRTALECELTLLLIECARILERYAPEDGEPNRYVGYAAAAMRFIDAHFAEDISIGDVAGHVGLSPDYLTRQFRQVTGLAPVSYLRRYRLARAMELLGTGTGVTETADRVGFQSLAHFSREFKQELGVSPSQYRKNRLTDEGRSNSPDNAEDSAGGPRPNR